MSRMYARSTFFNQTVFDTPQIVQFIGCTPVLKALDIACVVIEDGAARVNLLSQTSGYRELAVWESPAESDWQSGILFSWRCIMIHDGYCTL
jgi:hypothetical protein